MCKGRPQCGGKSWRLVSAQFDPSARSEGFFEGEIERLEKHLNPKNHTLNGIDVNVELHNATDRNHVGENIHASGDNSRRVNVFIEHMFAEITFVPFDQDCETRRMWGIYVSHAGWEVRLTIAWLPQGYMYPNRTLN